MIVVSNQNITLSLPEEDLREARILAASRVENPFQPPKAAAPE